MSLILSVKQTGPPKILFKKKLFVVGENLIANCTTTRAKPHPHITWLINGIKVKRNSIVSFMFYNEGRESKARACIKYKQPTQAQHANISSFTHELKEKHF